MGTLGQDLRCAVRALQRNPDYTLIAVLTLALGIGANTAMFSVLSGVLFRPLPYPSPNELVMVWTESPSEGRREGRSTYRDVEQWRALSKSFVDMAVFDPVSVNLTTPSHVERISSMRVSPNFFALLGVSAQRGRIYSAEEAEARQRVVVISHRFWQARLAGDENVVGSSVEIDGVTSQVVGVLPQDFSYGDSDVWEPHSLFADWESRRGERGDASWFVLGRLRPDVAVEQAQVELGAIDRRLDEQRLVSERGRGVNITPLSLRVVPPSARLALWMLSAAVFLVLLIAVANITSLSLARSASREREFAVRSALGAGKAHLVRLLLTESVTLAVVSALVGIVVAEAAVPLIVGLRPAGLALPASVNVDGYTLAWTVALTMFAGIAVGVVPAVAVARDGLQSGLRESGRGSSSGKSARATRRILVVAEFALAIVLLVGAGLLTRSLLKLQRVDLGFNPDRVLSMQLSLPNFPRQQWASYYEQVLEQVHGVAGVERAGIIGDLFTGPSAERVVTVEGRGNPQRLRIRIDEVSSALFSTLDVPIINGRPFSSDDRDNAVRVAIVNVALANQLWPSQDAVGRRFKLGALEEDSPWFTVVGVVGDVRRQGFENAPGAQMFQPLAQNPSRLATLLVRTSLAPAGMAGAVQDAIRRVDRRTPVYGVTTLDARLAGFQAERRFHTMLLALFSIAALLLAAIGIYGVVQYSTAIRTREIGIRMAVGAERRDIFAMVVGEGLRLALTGLALGLIAAFWLAQLGASLLFNVNAADPPTYVIVSLVLTAAAVAACYFPARRAARLDPLRALRYE